MSRTQQITERLNGRGRKNLIGLVQRTSSQEWQFVDEAIREALSEKDAKEILAQRRGTGSEAVQAADISNRSILIPFASMYFPF